MQMADFIKIPVRGTIDRIPSEMKMRQDLLTAIRENYGRYGFQEIETPVLEHLSNLTSKQGGDNEKLIFKVQKRGEEFKRALETGDELCDCGLRYDLTVPLARFYANNDGSLPDPFKAMQLAYVWRADRPQKGRFRQFMQCDIDILGDNTNFAEIELINATSDMLGRLFEGLDVGEITIHVNDRKILIGAALYSGFTEEQIPSVLITLDKLDKIGLDGVEKELSEFYPAEVVSKYIGIYRQDFSAVDCRSFCSRIGSDFVSESVIANLDEIIACGNVAARENIKVVFDPTLVRGMGYYTGPIFEVSLPGYGFSVGGGGRYDEMIGKFSGMNVSAVGFSLGFDRILTVLADKNAADSKIVDDGIAFLVDSKASLDLKKEVIAEASRLRSEGRYVTVQTMKKNAKRQLGNLEKDGYTDIRRIQAKRQE